MDTESRVHLVLPDTKSASSSVNHLVPSVRVRSPHRLSSDAEDPPKVMTPTSDDDSDAALKCVSGSLPTPIMTTPASRKVPRFDLVGTHSDTNTNTSGINGGRLPRLSYENEAHEELTEYGLTPQLPRPSRELGPASMSLQSQPAASPRVMRLKAKAPTVAVNETSGEIEKMGRELEDSISVYRSHRSLNSTKSAPDGRLLAGTLGSAGPSLSDPFWHFRLRDIVPPKHPRLKKAGHYCRKIITFMFSHVGLFLLVAGYTALGGFIFPALENERALRIRQELHEQTQNLSEKLFQEVWKIGLELVTADQYMLDDTMIEVCNFVLGSHKSNDPQLLVEKMAYLRVIAEDAARKIKESEDSVKEAAADCHYRRRRGAEDIINISEDQADATAGASFDGDGVSRKFELFSIIWKSRNQKRLQKKIDTMVGEFRHQVYRQTIAGWDGRDTFNHDTQWTFVGALLYTITVVTTIGYGHMVPRTFEGRIVTIVYSLVGIPLTLLCVANMGSLFASSFRLSYLYVSELFCGESSLFSRWKAQRERKREQQQEAGNTSWYTRLKLLLATSSVGDAILRIRARQMLIGSQKSSEKAGEQKSVLASIRKDGQKLRRRQKIRVPVSVTLLAISGYLLLGALLFSSIESWEMFEAFYFCYITLSTIGFGDFVPGTETHEEAQWKLALCSLYLICGLGMMSMTIQLMQDEVRLKVKKLAEHIGLVKTRRMRDSAPR